MVSYTIKIEYYRTFSYNGMKRPYDNLLTGFVVHTSRQDLLSFYHPQKSSITPGVIVLCVKNDAR